MPQVQILESRLRLVLRQMFEAGADAATNCESTSEYKACRFELVHDCMNELRKKKYLRPARRLTSAERDGK